MPANRSRTPRRRISPPLRAVCRREGHCSSARKLVQDVLTLHGAQLLQWGRASLGAETTCAGRIRRRAAVRHSRVAKEFKLVVADTYQDTE
jgi:hypothetical protein